MKPKNETHYILDRDAKKEAETHNLVCCIPGKTDLQIDLDTEDQYKQFCKAFSVMSRYRSLEIVSLQWSRSGAPHRHIYLNTTRVSDTKRVALQAMLGSDVVRENLSMQRIACGYKNPTVLFELPGFCKKIDFECAGPSMMLSLSFRSE